MRVTMVKKRLLSGEECPKCLEATAFLEGKGVLGRIDEVVWFDERTPGGGPGGSLAETHGMTRAPFFLVERQGRVEAFDSVMRVYKLL
jgi:hypothetical protein